MVDIDKLKEAIKKEKAIVAEEEETLRLEAELFELKNREEIKKRKVRSERIKSFKKIAGKVLRGAGKQIAAGAKSIDAARQPGETRERLKKIQGIPVPLKTKGKKVKKGKKIKKVTRKIIQPRTIPAQQPRQQSALGNPFGIDFEQSGSSGLL